MANKLVHKSRIHRCLDLMWTKLSGAVRSLFQNKYLLFANTVDGGAQRISIFFILNAKNVISVTVDMHTERYEVVYKEGSAVKKQGFERAYFTEFSWYEANSLMLNYRHKGAK